MKNIILSTLFLFMICLITISYADGMYTASEHGASTAQDEFDLNTTPWLFLSIPEGKPFMVTLFRWDAPGNKYYTTPYVGNSNWYAFNSFTFKDSNGNFNSWDNIKNPGDWSINLNYENTNNNKKNPVTLVTNFSLMPEPISSILFMLGGGLLAYKQYKKRKINI